MERLFLNGSYRGEGHWIDQKTEGRYSAQYVIVDGPNGAKEHQVVRVFWKPDGGVAYEERTTVSFEPRDRSSVWVTIHGPQGSVAGPGYVFDHECHYDLDVTPDNHLEFTFRAEAARVHGLGSATNKGNRTYWRETLDRA
jgi:hypothetical protein